MLTTWLDGLKHVEAVEADPRVCYDSCCFQKMVLLKHWSIAIPRNPNIIPQNQKIKRHQKTKTVLPRPPTVRRSVSHFRSFAWDSALAPLDMAWQHGLPWQNMSDGKTVVTVVTVVTVTIWDACDPMGRGIWTTLSNPFWCLRFEMDLCGPWRHRFDSGIEPVEQLICDVTWCYVMLAYVFIELRIQFWWGWRHFLLKWMAGRPSSSRCFCRPTML